MRESVAMEMAKSVPEAKLLVEVGRVTLSFRPLPEATVEDLAMAEEFARGSAADAIAEWQAECFAAMAGGFVSREPSTRCERPVADTFIRAEG